MPIVRKEVTIEESTRFFDGGKRTLERWVAAYRRSGQEGLRPQSTRPKAQPNETSIRVKERIIELRQETRLCAEKMNFKLRKEGIRIDTRTIGKILKSEGLVRKYRIRKLQYKYIKPTLKPGDMVEIDIKYVPGRIRGKRYYQYTAIDCATRWRYLEVYENGDNESSLSFLEKLMTAASFPIRAIKTDNGTCFTNRYVGYLKSSSPHNPKRHALDERCGELGITHYLIDPGKPAQNGKVERSHRTDQEMFYDRNSFSSLRSLQIRLRKWNNYYNNLEHCSLGGQTPNEALADN